MFEVQFPETNVRCFCRVPHFSHMSNAIYQSSREGGLSRFDEEFRAETLEERPEVAAVPDGRYRVIIERADLTQSATSGNPRLYWALRITGPNCQGRVIGKGHSITSSSLKWIKQELHICGIDPEPFSELPGLLENMLGVELEITKRTKDGYENVYFEKKVTSD